jgi:hypothetical protein
MQPQRCLILVTDEHDMIARAAGLNLILRQFSRLDAKELPFQIVVFALRHAAWNLKDGVVLVKDDPYLSRIARLTPCQRGIARHPELVGVNGVEWPRISNCLADGLLHCGAAIPRDQEWFTAEETSSAMPNISES